MDTWALIPVKSLQDSKRRLARLLPAEQRAALIRGLLLHELNVLSQLPVIDKVLVISSDPTVWRIARQNGVLVEEELESCGLNVAVSRGVAVAAENGASAALILPVDLPFITASDVDLMVSTGLDKISRNQEHAISQGNNGFHSNDERGCVMAICSDREGDGTNAIFINPGREFTFHFGPRSFESHIQEAQERGMVVRVVSAPGLSFDLDNENDWFTYQTSIVCNC